MIDIWMLFTMIVPFLEVILHTATEVFKRPKANDIRPGMADMVKVKSTAELEEEEEEEAPKTRKRLSSILLRLAGGIFLPGISIIFIVSFWIVGLVVSYSSSDANQDSNMTNCLTIDLNWNSNHLVL